ncbi:MAG TPA: ABC transporter substrate-binding protein [Candidatus Binatia bacterium]|jgi:phospholipid transport system substrate-binding protein|nr:ABC transporter substrate-binding protein [Candidatus Binatia bacterium]
MIIRTTAALTLVAAALAFVAPRAGAADDPKAVVTRVTNEALEVLRDDSLSADAKRQKLEQIVLRDTDFETLSRLVLAQNWRKFSEAQQAEFIEQFRRHLSMTYGRNIENYHNETVAVQSERQEPRGDVTVLTKIVRGGGASDIEVDYRLRKNAEGQWKVIDFVIEGVSLVANFRAQFTNMLSSSSPATLIKTLADKNARNEPLKAPGTGT